jgi:hypothetical protein
VLAAALLVACGSAAHAPTPTIRHTSAVPTLAPTSPLSSDITRTIENVVLACRQKDAALLRTYIAADVSVPQTEALFALGRDVTLRSQTASVTGDQASVALDLQIERDTGFENVRRTWQLTHGADGLWHLTALPDCY